MHAAATSWRRRVAAVAAAAACATAAVTAVTAAAAGAPGGQPWRPSPRVLRAAAAACDARRPGAPPGVVGAWAPPWAAAAAAAAPSTPLPPRGRVPRAFTWAIETLYPSAAAAAAEERSLASTLASLTLDDVHDGSLPSRLRRLYVYARMRHHTDAADDAAANAYRRVTALFDVFPAAFGRAMARADWTGGTTCAAAGPLDLPSGGGGVGGGGGVHPPPPQTMQCPAGDDPPRRELAGQRRQDLAGERRPALRDALHASARAAARARAALVGTAGAYAPIRDAAGVAHPVTDANFVEHVGSRDRVRREAAWRSVTGWHGAHTPVLAELLGWAVDASVAEARSIGFSSAVDRALQSNSIPTSVYTSLIHTVRAALPRTMHKYTALRRRLLAARWPASAGPFELRPWDLSAPLIPDVQFRFPYDAARALVVESVAPLGGAYQEAVRSGLYEDRWVDVYPNAGKRPGAYSAGIHETLSFIFLNYDDTLSGVLTLAHEVGHSAHALLARAAQRNHFSDAPYFVSEVASTFNEALLFETLAAHASSPAERAAVLAARVDRAASLFFLQTRAAELELTLTTAAAAGTPLSVGFLKATYAALSAAYYGPALVAGVGDEARWATSSLYFAPYGFYVYQYATAFAAAAALRNRTATAAAGVEGYLDALRAGGSTDALAILRGAGVDMNTTAPLTAACDLFERLVDELAATTAALGLLPSPPPSAERPA